MDRSLRRELKPVFGNNYWFDTVTYLDLVDEGYELIMKLYKSFSKK